MIFFAQKSYGARTQNFTHSRRNILHDEQDTLFKQVKLLFYKNNLIAGTHIAIEAQAEIKMTRSKFFDKFLFGVRRMKKHLLALALIAATGAAQAATVTQSAPLVQEVTEIDQAFDFNQFDSSLGTLNSVSIILDGAATSSVSFTNRAAQDQNFSFKSTLSLYLVGVGLSEQLDLALFDYPRTLTAVGTTDLGTVNAADSVTISATDLAAFIGTKTANLACESGVTNSQSGGGGNIDVSQTTTAGCGITVVYDYTVPTPPPAPIPEPASMALIGLGALGLAAVRRRK